MIKYYPYKSDEPNKKYFIITNNNKKFILVRLAPLIFTIHKDEARKQRYINRHKDNESQVWNDPDTASCWDLKYLWTYPTKEEAYSSIKKDLKKKGFILGPVARPGT